MKMSLKNLLIFFVLSALALTATCQVKHGQPAGRTEFKYLVYIEIEFALPADYDGSEDGPYLGGGVIIGDRWVLTAAHNFESVWDRGVEYQPNNIKIVAGSKSDKADANTEGAQIFNVNMAAVEMDDGWKEDDDPSYDFALIYLGRNQQIRLTETVAVAVLIGENDRIRKRSRVTVVGWGRSETEENPEMARKGEMYIIPSRLCKEYLNLVRNARFPFFDQRFQLCYGCTERTGDCAMGAHGDSGSPVVQFRNHNDRIGVVIGIHRASCAADSTIRCTPQQPGAAIDIRNIRGWIEETKEFVLRQQASFFPFEKMAGAFSAAASAFGFC